MSESEKRRAIMAQSLAANPGLVPKGCIEIGYLLCEYLESAVADEGTAVDTGAGLGSFDLWVKVGGEEYYISVKKRAQ